MLTFWIIIVLMILSVIALIWDENTNRYSSDFLVSFAAAIILIVGFIIALALGLSMVTSVPEEIAVFKLQKEYIESQTDLDTSILSLQKVEQNQWLFEVQTKVNRYGLFSIYPESVLELKPIE